VGETIGASLVGWTYRKSALFSRPLIDLDGRLAKVLLEQKEEIELLESMIETLTED